MYFVGKPNITDKEEILRQIEAVLDSEYLSNNGPKVKELEKLVSEALGVKYCVAVNNATIGLDIALDTLEGDGRYIAVPSFTFVSTVNQIVRHGYEPLFIDINDSYCMSFIDLCKHLYKDIAAIIPCNLFGNICSTNLLESLGKPIIYDSAHALLCKGRDGKYIGNYGDMEIFSLHATKFINSAEGGLITTNDEAIYKKLLYLRDFGFNKGDGTREGSIVDIGTNAKMSEIHAAIGLVNFSNRQDLLDKYRLNYSLYSKYLAPGVLKTYNTKDTNYSYIHIEAKESIREGLINYLESKHIHARSYFQAIHRSPAYKRYNMVCLPKTESASKRIVHLPQHMSLKEEDIKYICKCVNNYLMMHK